MDYSKLTAADLKSIAAFKRIVKNYLKMLKIGGGTNDGGYIWVG